MFYFRVHTFIEIIVYPIKKCPSIQCQGCGPWQWNENDKKCTRSDAVFCKEGLSNDDQQFQQYQLHEQLSLSPQHTKTKIHADGNAGPGTIHMAGFLFSI